MFVFVSGNVLNLCVSACVYLSISLCLFMFVCLCLSLCLWIKISLLCIKCFQNNEELILHWLKTDTVYLWMLAFIVPYLLLLLSTGIYETSFSSVSFLLMCFWLSMSEWQITNLQLSWHDYSCLLEILCVTAPTTRCYCYFLSPITYYFTMHLFKHLCNSLYQNWASGGTRTNDLNIIGLEKHDWWKTDALHTELIWVHAVTGNFVNYQVYIHKVYA